MCMFVCMILWVDERLLQAQEMGGAKQHLAVALQAP